ncbi:DUF6233 domain-containing protein [Streptomyces sp. NBC_01800]|uniref:DUF6233 domain-containing protein n=1 Tax=Streptomyces sp. NBC_01800 TaxID=2975945 RepID=UPI002DDA1580|nr:DUF6233 domain-containing protein [Streptomyces sp. NBC_01800]WSA68849.1 DUF6233 domain-containing protein [Streptomyces sp. NBC_01800]
MTDGRRIRGRLPERFTWSGPVRQQAKERRPTTPDWIVELSIGVGARPIEVHVGGCYAAGKRHRAITREQALAALADGIRACIHCRPDTELGVL